jgi:hypothetical protein
MQKHHVIKNAEHKFQIHIHQLIFSHSLHTGIYNGAKLVHQHFTMKTHRVQIAAWMGKSDTTAINCKKVMTS